MGGGGCCVRNCCVVDLPCANCGLIRKIAEKLFGSDCCVGNSAKNIGQVDENSEIALIAKMQDALAEFKDDTQSRSSEFENEVIAESRKALDEFINELRKYNKIRYGNRCLDININNIERENRKTEDKIHGFIIKRVSKQISFDNEECKEILKMDAGNAKKDALDAFYKKVLKEAVRELSDELQDIMEKQTDNVCERIQHRIDSIVDIYEAKEAEFDSIRKVKEKDEDAVEQEQIRLSHHVALCEYGLAILG